MRYSRAGIVAVLLAAEVFIGGAILWALSGGRAMSVQAAGLHAVSEHGKAFAPIAAGDAPHVVIDDPDSHIVISPSSDGMVHVTDDTRIVGWVWGPKASVLSVARIGDGVEIRRDGGGRIGLIGLDFQHTRIAVPPGAFVDVQRCGGASLSGLAGRLHLHSVDGGVRGENLRLTGGDISTDDGSVRLAFAGGNFDLQAHTGDGSIHINGERVSGDDDSAGAHYQVGTGGGSLQVSTQDGSIRITTNGALHNVQ